MCGKITKEELQRLADDPKVMANLKRGIEALNTGEMVTLDELFESLGMERPATRDNLDGEK